MHDILGATTYRALRAGLDAAALRHEVLAHNMANVDTPGFKARDVSFEESLRAALADADSPEEADLSRVGPTIYRIPSYTFRNDGNTVDVDWEVTKMAQNQERYAALAGLLRRNVALWRRTLTDLR